MQIFYLLSIIIVLVMTMLIAVLFSYIKLLTKYKKRTESAENAREKVIERAQESAEKIIEEAGMISDNLEEEIARIIKQKTQESVSNILGTLRRSTDNDIKEFENEIKNETNDFKNLYSQKLAEEIEKIEFDLEAYKKVRKSTIDKEAAEIVKKVVKEALGESLDDEKHEQIVRRALDEVAKGGVFSK